MSRGRGTPAARLRAQAHAKHGYYCTCGKAMYGNGARAQHLNMHKRLEDGHHYITHSAWLEARAKEQKP